MTYVTKDMERLPNGFKQKFRYEPTDTASVSKKRLIELVQRGAITKRDIVLMKFFYKFSIATPELVEKACGMKQKDFVERAEALIQNRILNKFVLHDSLLTDEPVPENAKVFYSCDMGTPMLLECFESGQDYENWRITDHVICESSKVERYLMTIKFYLELREALGNRLMMFETAPKLSMGRSKVKPNAVFCVNHDGNKRFFVLNAVREEDLFTMDGNRFTAKLNALETLLSTDIWKSYYVAEEKPVLLLLSDTEAGMKQIGSMAAQTKIEAVRLTTTERISQGFGATKVFAKFNPETNRVSNVKVSILAPKK